LLPAFGVAAPAKTQTLTETAGSLPAFGVAAPAQQLHVFGMARAQERVLDKRIAERTSSAVSLVTV
jgi:hypothetical protein